MNLFLPAERTLAAVIIPRMTKREGSKNIRKLICHKYFDYPRRGRKRRHPKQWKALEEDALHVRGRD